MFASHRSCGLSVIRVHCTLCLLTNELLNSSFLPQVPRQGMARLHDEGYRTVTFLELVNSLKPGGLFPERSLRLHSLVLSIAAGFRDA